MTDWKKYRRAFPALSTHTYLNTAGGCALPRAAAEAGKTFYEEMCSFGDTCWDSWTIRYEQTRSRVAASLSVEPNAVSLLPTATHGLNYIAHLLCRAGDHVLACDQEFPSTVLPWINNGAEVSFVPLQHDGSVAPEAFVPFIRTNTRCIVVSHVQYHTGARHDLRALAEICEAHGLELIVDAVQSFGAVSLDLSDIPVSALVFSGYKWALGGYGIAGMYMKPDLVASGPKPLAGWRSSKNPAEMVFDRLDFAADGKVLEGGHPMFAASFALEAGLEMINKIGLAKISARNDALVRHLHDTLQENGLQINSPLAVERRSAVVMIDMPDAEQVRKKLLERHIFVGARKSSLRVSTHFYNTKDDIDYLMSELPRIRSTQS